GVGDDGEGAPARGFPGNVGHGDTRRGGAGRVWKAGNYTGPVVEAVGATDCADERGLDGFCVEAASAANGPPVCGPWLTPAFGLKLPPLWPRASVIPIRVHPRDPWPIPASARSLPGGRLAEA